MAKDIKVGEFVIEYVGEGYNELFLEGFFFIIIIKATYDLQVLPFWNMKQRGERNFYLCEINRDMVIDATYKGNKSRYTNHSCCPNTEMQKWLTTNCFTRMMFVVIFGILSKHGLIELGTSSNKCILFVFHFKDN